MRGSGRRRQQDATEDVGGQLLLSFGVLEGLLPIGGSELEQTIPGPARDEAEEIAQVREGLDVVEASAGEQRNEDGVHERAVVAAHEEPIFATEHKS